MGDIVKLPARAGGRAACATPLLDLFRRLNPRDQVAIAKAAEIVLEMRRAERPPDDGEE